MIWWFSKNLSSMVKTNVMPEKYDLAFSQAYFVRHLLRIPLDYGNFHLSREENRNENAAMTN